ncbi:LON peptidase N-terminal domain and RING finger protein 3, partial [Orchesella cincta]
EEALQDAEAATKSCPTWPKGYFRKSAALISLGRYEEAFLSLTICMYLIKATSKSSEDPALSQVINEMMKIFHKIFLQSPVTGSTLKRHTSEQLQFTPYPSTKKLNGRTDRRRQGYKNWSSDLSEYSSSGDECEQSMYSGKSCSGWKSSRSNHHHESISVTHHHSHNSMGPNYTHSSSPLTEQLNVRLNRLFGRASQDLKCFELRLKGLSKGLRQTSPALISGSDVECSLCYRLLFQPVSTGCGHTFCRCCLERCMDHNPACPLCKTSLQNYLANRDHSVTEFLESAIRSFLPNEYEERLKQHLEELNAVPSAGKSLDVDIPIFVCTMAFPTIPCPLHVFEPRYRLMIRRCMENGTNKFGMCCYAADGEHNYGDVGTLLEIRNIRYFSDGRSVVDTMGCRRFRVLRKSMVDGYNAAKIELLQDRPISETDMPIINELHDKVFKEANEWLQSIGQVRRQRIHSHFGLMPSPTDDWRDSPDGPSWTWWLLAILPLDSKAQLAILSMCSLQKRLECILKVLTFVKNRMNSLGGEETQPEQQ